jgi:predicted nucleic acid-binding Zn ribbon protein
MDQETLFAGVNRTLKRKRPAPIKFATMAGEFERFIKKTAKPAKRNTTVPQAFAQAIGETLARNCKIESISKGVLKVKVKSGPYMFAIQTQTDEIIEKLQVQCPAAKIREIKILSFN